MNAPRLKTILQAITSALIAAGLLYLSMSVIDTDLILLITAIASLATPRRFVWATLFGWATFWIGWATYEAVIWMQGNGKFGPMSWIYCLGGLVLLVAAILAYRRIQPKPDEDLIRKNSK